MEMEKLRTVLRIWRERRRVMELTLKEKKIKKRASFFDSFMKVLVIVIVSHGLLGVTASYVLAFCGYENALETLSETLIHEVMGPVVTYGFTKMVENVSKYNDWIEKYMSRKYCADEEPRETEETES